ncbi:galactose mutarotase-like domain-containing protein [Aspergillus sergii]|uniref:Galactose mutarotase-like domain-containing protein n=1 Tax=Aspergillus sergii TaxID=1034303 RepID=A0A5N6X8Z5_9EURO|nr:galactose mutarotase-like domain-containing protein [Aspergillus sergii]
MLSPVATRVLLVLSLVFPVFAHLSANETSTAVTIANDRLAFSVKRSTGAVDSLILDNQDLLGAGKGTGPYLDCYCVPDGGYVPGHIDPEYRVIRGVDSSNVSYGGVIMSESYPPTGQVLQQYWFLRDGETGLHTFSRVAYHNSTEGFSVNLQGLRTLFRPHSKIWTHLVLDDDLWAPLPIPDPATGDISNAVPVQDTTWYLGNREGDPFVEQFADYFTKYTFADSWRDHTAHGLFADGLNVEDNLTFGAWLVMNTKDTYFGGPLYSDLTVDGYVYNSLTGNHHGMGTPNITTGFDRTFGPQYYHFNTGPAGTSWRTLREEAVQYASPTWNAEFYDSIAQYVPNYVPTSGRGSWKAVISLPEGAKNPVAVLSLEGVDFQDNSNDSDAYQYWADIDSSSGKVQIDRIRAGRYRLTVYADGVFGDFVHDGIVVEAGKNSDGGTLLWKPDSAGKELWRIGTPDKSGGEWRHGNVKDKTHPLHPPEYRIYWGQYDFITDFPNGVNFHVGSSDESRDFNYIHWSVFGGSANYRRPEQVTGHGEINNWTITFGVVEHDLRETSLATFTVQLAGVKTAAGNTNLFNASQTYNNLPYAVFVNGHELDTWIIPYYHSSSCGTRSGISCYQVSNKFTFPSGYLRSGNASNEIILSLPFNATDYEAGSLPSSLYVQYDALRLEVK